MIDLSKERKAFEKMWIEIGGNPINFTFDKNMYVWSSQEPKDKTETILIDLATRSINGAWAVFLTKEREKQSEIDKLKAKLAKVESGEWVIVPEEPTERMLDSAYSSISDNLHYADLENIYKAMIRVTQENEE